MAKPKNAYRKEAKRDVKLYLKPQRQAIRRARRTAKREGRQQDQKLVDIGGSLEQALAGLNPQFASMTSGISSGLTDAINGLSGQFGQSIGVAAPSEIQPGLNLTGGIGSGALSQLANTEMRNATYNTSAQRQGAEQTAYDRKASQMDLRDFLQDLSQQKIDLMSMAPAMMRQRQDELSRAGFDRRMSLANLALSQDQNALGWAGFNYDVGRQDAIDAAMADMTPAERAAFMRAMGY